MDKRKKKVTLYKNFKTKYPTVAETIKPVRKGLKLTAQTTAKVAIVAMPVVSYLPFIGAAVGAGVGIIDSTSILSLKLPSITDIVLPAALGGVIGHQTKKVIKTISKEGLSNPSALAEIGVGTVSLIGNLTLNSTPTPINTIAVVGGSMVATSMAKHYIAKKQMTIKELEEEHKKLNKRSEYIRKKTAKMVRNFDEIKNDVNSYIEDKTISPELKQIHDDIKRREKWLQEQIDKDQVPDINRGIGY